MMAQFPDDCTLIEWSEGQQGFYVNRVRNGIVEKETNNHIVTVVHACKNDKIAFLIIEYMEKYVLKKSSKFFTGRQIMAHITALTKFAISYRAQ